MTTVIRTQIFFVAVWANDWSGRCGYAVVTREEIVGLAPYGIAATC